MSQIEISEAEREVMEALWASSPLTAQQVIEHVENANWSERTVKTLLNRLLKKGALGFEKEGRTYLYYPKLDRKAYTRVQSKRLVDRLFGGALTPLVSSFAEQGELKKDDIAALKKLLEGLEEKK